VVRMHLPQVRDKWWWGGGLMNTVMNLRFS